MRIGEQERWRFERTLTATARRKIEAWKRSKALNADGYRADLPAHPNDVNRAIASEFPDEKDRRLATVSLWRHVSGLHVNEIVARSGLAPITIHRWLKLHDRRMNEDLDYASAVSSALRMIDTVP